MNFKSNIPIYLQIIDEIKTNIITGALPLGSKASFIQRTCSAVSDKSEYCRESLQ